MEQAWPHRPGTESRDYGRRAWRRPRGGKPALGRLSAIRSIVGIAVLIGLCVLTGLVSTSEALFFTNSSNPGNVLSAGTLTVINSSGDSCVLDADRLRPGQSLAGTLALTNQGDFTAGCTVAKESLVDSTPSNGLSSVLTLRIEDVTANPALLWSGILADFESTSLGSLAFGETRDYRFTLAFPLNTASPSLQGASTTMQMTFTAVTQ